MLERRGWILELFPSVPFAPRVPTASFEWSKGLNETQAPSPLHVDQELRHGFKKPAEQWRRCLYFLFKCGCLAATWQEERRMKAAMYLGRAAAAVEENNHRQMIKGAEREAERRQRVARYFLFSLSFPLTSPRSPLTLVAHQQECHSQEDKTLDPLLKQLLSPHRPPLPASVPTLPLFRGSRSTSIPQTVLIDKLPF